MTRLFDEQSTKRIKDVEAEVKRLKQLHHDIYEVYAGSEGLPCETISESYLCVLIRKMVALAVEGKQ
jgi:hypothetical protein